MGFHTKGFAEKYSQADFIKTIYVFMDLLAPIIELCLFFPQTQDLNIASV